MKIKLKEKEYNIVDSIGELKLEEYFDFMKLKELFEKEELTDVEYITEIISLLSGIHPDELMTLTIESMNELYEYVIEIIKKQMPVENIKYPVIIGEDKFYLDTKLDEMSYGQWLSIMNFIKMNDCSTLEVAPEFLAMFLRKKNEKYDVNVIKSRIELFKNNLKFKHLHMVSTFFLTFYLELQKLNSKDYLQQMK